MTRKKLIMNVHNLALEREEDNSLSDLFSKGKTDAVFAVDPVHPESPAYWSGYSAELRKKWVAKNNPSPTALEHKQKQGELCQTAWAITKHYGKMKPIGTEKDYKGWEIEINGLEIDIITFDWEEAEKETKWWIYSTHPDAIEYLSKIFGECAIKDMVTEKLLSRLKKNGSKSKI